MHRVGHRDTVSLFSTECNMTAGVGIPQVDTRQICPSSLDTTSGFAPPWKKSCGRPCSLDTSILRTHPNFTSYHLSIRSSFSSNWKCCSLANPILIHPLPHASLPVSTPNITHHSRLTACLTLWILTPLHFDFVLVKQMWINWIPRPITFCGRCRNLEFTITIINRILTYSWAKACRSRGNASELTKSPCSAWACTRRGAK